MHCPYDAGMERPTPESGGGDKSGGDLDRPLHAHMLGDGGLARSMPFSEWKERGCCRDDDSLYAYLDVVAAMRTDAAMAEHSLMPRVLSSSDGLCRWAAIS